PDGRSLAISSEDGHLGIYRLEGEGAALRLRQVVTHLLRQEKLEALSFDRAGDLVASRGPTIWFAWPPDGDSPHAEEIAWRVSNPCRVVASPGGRTLAVGGGRKVRLLDTARRAWRPGECKLPSVLRCLEYAPDGRLLAVGTADGRIILLDPVTREI